MRFFEVKKISYHAPNKGYSIDLVEMNGETHFSILINSNEVQSIALALEGIKVPRPTPHDIILDILNSSDVELNKVELYKIFKGNFYARLHIKNIHIGEKQIDCKPSDAIAIALRYCCPIDVSNHVLNNIKSTEIISDSNFNAISEYKKQDSLEQIVKKLYSA